MNQVIKIGRSAVKGLNVTTFLFKFTFVFFDGALRDNQHNQCSDTIAIEPHASLKKTKCLGLYAIVFYVLVVNNMNVGWAV